MFVTQNHPLIQMFALLVELALLQTPANVILAMLEVIVN
jgi:hypothetical protein